jgi:peptidoglycan-associated lipoprotein
MENFHGARMSTARPLVLGAVAILACACAANPKSAKSSTEINDALVASAPAPAASPMPAADPAPAPAAPATATCSLVRVGFAFDSAQLDEGAMRILRENADCLSRRGATALLVEGHCDERGTTEYNIALGARRADAVKRYLAGLGVTAAIDSVSFGKELPIATGSGDAAWAQNRRAEMRLAGDTRSDGQRVAAH